MWELPAHRPREAPEAQIQRAVVEALRAALPHGAVVHHSANEIGQGGRGGRARQAIRKGMGVFPGFSDLLVISEGRVAFLEVKAPGGRLSRGQERFRDLILAQGLPWALVRSVEDALAALDAAGIAHRARTARTP